MQEYNELLAAWLSALGGTPATGDGSWTLLYKIAQAYGATPAPGDTIPDLARKIRISVGDADCHCGDNDWQSFRRILDRLSPGSAAPDDLIWDLLRKIVDAVS